MSAVLVSLADGLAAEINDHDFTTTFDFEAVRSWGENDLELSEEALLKVEVVPVGYISAVQQARGGDVHYQPVCNIVLRYKFPKTDTGENDGRIDQEQIDQLTQLTEQIIELLASPSSFRLSAFTDATFSTISIETIAPRNYLREQRQFVAVLKATYDVVKEP